MGRTKHGGLQPARPSPGSAGSTGGNRCVDAAEACTADAQCQQLRSEYVARCLGRPAPGDRSGPGGCVRSRCRRALRRFFARGPPALTHALLFCRCESPACAERRRQTFAPACAFAGPGPAPPSCLKALDRCERGRLCRHRSHPQLPGQRERARRALVRLRGQRKPVGRVRSLPQALYREPLLGRSQKHVLCLRVKAVDECSHTRNVHLSCLLPHGGKENSTTPQNF
ncbi:GDNF family receptor alpha-4 isoform X8 [Peromyscus californicus insignis]|uniref:GDNF family receptor alpha-4 isoform X8 n=1 Tax=Peromyscus californicus insignis TaxID=564181 RepID=UPI0022A75C9B|nr:GDNF family receptor alpha-4 isoform X8 [Peromyscus californicus insignis]